jgi:hypothetical protein
MGYKARLKRSRSQAMRSARKLEQFRPGSLVKVKEDVPFARAGVYECTFNSAGLICLGVGNVGFGLGSMFAEFLEEIPTTTEVSLMDEQLCIDYANEMIKRLDGGSNCAELISGKIVL